MNDDFFLWWMTFTVSFKVKNLIFKNGRGRSDFYLNYASVGGLIWS